MDTADDSASDLTAKQRRATSIRLDPPVPVPLGIGYRTVHPDGSTVDWRIVAEGTGVTVDDRFDDADITLSCDADTAAALTSGALSVQRAVLDGRLELGGDLTALVEYAHVADAVVAVARGA